MITIAGMAAALNSCAGSDPASEKAAEKERIRQEKEAEERMKQEALEDLELWEEGRR